MAESELTLVDNARIWISGHPDYNWMIINTNTGYVCDVGRLGDQHRFKWTKQIDMGGRRIFPGFHDSHLHVSILGDLLCNLGLVNCKSIEKLKELLAEHLVHFPNKKQIRGRGWDDNLLGRLPTKEDIDSICSDKPVMLTRVCCHAAVVNSAALSLAGISKDETDPGFDRYPPGHPKAGEFTGILREDAADKVRKYFVKTRDDIEQCVKAGVRECLKRGLTGVHSNEPTGSWAVYRDLANAGQLPIRVFFAGYFNERDPSNFPRACERHGDMLYSDRVKLFVDGALGVQTAALSIPYKGKDSRGALIHTREELNRMMVEATNMGFRLEVHVIGDEAAEVALDGFIHARVTPEKRPILTHCQVLRADLMSRMKKQGVIANIQPPFVPSDGSWLGKILPDELMPYAYAWKLLIDEGIYCAGGSDAPVESCDPLIGIYDSIFRRTRATATEESFTFRPEECLSVKQAVDLYTTCGAYTAMEEDRLGQLLPGYFADFVVIDSSKDVCDHPEEFSRARIAETWIAGRVVYRQQPEALA